MLDSEPGARPRPSAFRRGDARGRLVPCTLSLLLAACASSDGPDARVPDDAHPSDATVSDAAAHDAAAHDAAAHDAAPASPTALRPEGRWMVDAAGRIVLLHGVNVVWKLPPYFPPEEPDAFVAADADFLRDNGFNAVRLGVIYAGVAPTGPGAFDDAYLDAIARRVDLLWSRGIYVMLDFHQDMYNERFQGEGFPDWAVLDDGLPAEPRLGFPHNQFSMPALNRAYDHFWANDRAAGVPLQDAYAAGWERAARRFAGHPGVLGYDLFNEPWPGSEWPNCTGPTGCQGWDRAALQPMFERVEAAIRRADGARAVFYEPLSTFNTGAETGLWTAGSAPAGPTTGRGFSFHVYCGADGAGSRGDAGTGCEQIDTRVFELAERTAARGGAALLLTEFGATDDLAVVGRVTALADTHLVGWMYWSYKNFRDPTTISQDTGAQSMFADDTDLASLKPAKADLLVRPFARAVAGTPRAMAFDPATRAFTLAYVPDRAPGAPTEVFLPPRHYRCGYTVDARGARVTSAPGAPHLTLVAAPGAAEARVSVAPAPCP